MKAEGYPLNFDLIPNLRTIFWPLLKINVYLHFVSLSYNFEHCEHFEWIRNSFSLKFPFELKKFWIEINHLKMFIIHGSFWNKTDQTLR